MPRSVPTCISKYFLVWHALKAEKISPNDLAVFDEEVAPSQWSRRAHTLERIADRVEVVNRFPAYAEYTNDDKHRHLFQVCLVLCSIRYLEPSPSALTDVCVLCLL